MNQINAATNESFEAELARFVARYKNDTKIAPQIGTQCKGCQFRSEEEPSKSGFHECFAAILGKDRKDIKGPFVFDLWNFRKSEDLIDEGIYLLKDVPKKVINVRKAQKPGMSPTERQWTQVEATQNNSPKPFVDTEGLRAEMTTWNFPLHFIDFETSMVAIPFNKNRRPYEQIAFQFSHHILQQNGSIEHAGQYINKLLID